MNLDKDQLYDLLEQRRSDLGMSQSEVGFRAFGRRSNAALQSVRRGSWPSFDKVQAICAALDLNLEILPRGHEKGATNVSTNVEVVSDKKRQFSPREVDGAKYDPVPFYEEVKLSAGNGSLAASSAETYMAFRKEWFRSKGLQADECMAVQISGDSMEPTLRDGDHVLIDRGQTRIVNGEVYGIVDADGLSSVKRLQKAGENLIVRSDNPSFEVMLLSEHDASQVRVIGRVVWSDRSWI